MSDSNALESLKKYTTLVIDTGNFNGIYDWLNVEIEKYKPLDSTTNPSLILKYIENSNTQNILSDFLSKFPSVFDVPLLAKLLFVDIGSKILGKINGKVSIELDPRMSFDILEIVKEAKFIIEEFLKINIPKERILIKIASTWEGIEAGKLLQKEGINCNMTLIFSRVQAIQCAKANVYVISPFVGRISDWFKKHGDNFNARNDPGVQLVKDCYKFMKRNLFGTKVMGASFRNIDQILELTGIDLLTISPVLVEELENSNKICSDVGFVNEEYAFDPNSIIINEKKDFERILGQDKMASELLENGIKKFAEDLIKLENMIRTEIVRLNKWI